MTTHPFIQRNLTLKRPILKDRGSCPGIDVINQDVVYIESRNGNSAPHTMQDDTIERMFGQLTSQNIKVDIFRADSASYQFSTITTEVWASKAKINLFPSFVLFCYKVNV